MKKFYKNLPIETYVILLPSLVFLFAAGAYIFFRETGYAEKFFQGHFLSLVMAPNFTFSIFFLILSINVIEVFIMVKNYAKFVDIFGFMRSSLFVLSIFYVGGFALSLSTQLLFKLADPIRTAAGSILLTKWDYAIFGTYPWLSLHSLITSHWMQVFIYESYSYTLRIMLVLLVILVFKNVFLFRKFLLSFFIVTFIATPFWIAYPALAPDLMYRVNILNTPIPKNLQDNLDNTPLSEITKKVLLYTEDFWIDKNGDSLAITTFPSMHSAWGVIIAVVGIELWTPFAIILIPWLLAELTGTIFTMEHYAVDTIFGVVLGFLALYIASRLLEFDKKRFVDKWNLFVSLHQFNVTLKSIFSAIKRRWKRFAIFCGYK